MKQIILVLGFLSSAAYAECKRPGAEGVITVMPPPQLVVDSHARAPGEVIWSSGWVNGPDVEIKDCSNGYQVGFLYEPGSLQAGLAPVTSAQDGNGTAVFSTNLAGLGIAIKTQNNAGPWDNVMPIDNRYHPGDGGRNHTARSPGYSVALVALGGSIASGTATFSSPIARVSFRHGASEDSKGDILTRLWLGNTQVVMKALGCELDSNNLVLTLGKVGLSQFSSSQTAGMVQQNLRLSCEPGTAVTATLNAVPAAGNNPDNTVIALSYPDDPASASGVGVQIGMRVQESGFSTDALPINQPVQLFTHQLTNRANGGITVMGGTREQINELILTARYYKTHATVIPGQANATATLNLTYR